MSSTEGLQGAQNLGGKYLTFSLSNERYGVAILKVLELFGVKAITRVPRMPPAIKGVINLRGRIIPVIDLRLTFGLPEAKYTDKTCIIVANVSPPEAEQSVAVGMIVDTVLEVVAFDDSMIAPAPDYGAHLDTRLIMAMGRSSESDVTILLDIDKILAGEPSNAAGSAGVREQA